MMTPITAPTIPYTSASELSSSENKNINKLIYISLLSYCTLLMCATPLIFKETKLTFVHLFSCDKEFEVGS